jgi:hypothetical protein
MWSDDQPVAGAPEGARSPSSPEALLDPPEGALLDFTCPRCRLEVSEELYGPCTSCRTTLRAVIGGEARDVEQRDYEPKMNVTPNAIATKD